MTQQDNLIGVFSTVYKWRKFIFGLSLAAAVCSIIVSLTLPNYYRSKSVIKPYNLSNFERSVVFSEGLERSVPLFAGSNDINLVISTANSANLTENIIQHFNLLEYYQLDPEDPLKYSRVHKEFKSHYKAIKDEFDNIEISFLDQDPQLAADIVIYVVDYLGKKNIDLLKKRSVENMNGIKEKLQTHIQKLDNLTSIMESSPDTANASYRRMRKEQQFIIRDLYKYQNLFDQYQSMAESEFETFYIVENAVPADKKSQPVRWLIVTFSTLACFLMAIFGALVIEQYRHLKSKMTA